MYDHVIETVIKELRSHQDESANAFRIWLQTLIPKEGDEYNGYGGFIRQTTEENVRRWLDLRELTTPNQQLFWAALQKAATKLIINEQFKKESEGLINVLKLLLKMRRLAENGDHPDKLSDWKKGYVEPPTNNHIGPGW